MAVASINTTDAFQILKLSGNDPPMSQTIAWACILNDTFIETSALIH